MEINGIEIRCLYCGSEEMAPEEVGVYRCTACGEPHYQIHPRSFPSGEDC